MEVPAEIVAGVGVVFTALTTAIVAQWRELRAERQLAFKLALTARVAARAEPPEHSRRERSPAQDRLARRVSELAPEQRQDLDAMLRDFLDDLAEEGGKSDTGIRRLRDLVGPSSR